MQMEEIDNYDADWVRGKKKKGKGGDFADFRILELAPVQPVFCSLSGTGSTLLGDEPGSELEWQEGRIKFMVIQRSPTQSFIRNIHIRFVLMQYITLWSEQLTAAPSRMSVVNNIWSQLIYTAKTVFYEWTLLTVSFDSALRAGIPLVLRSVVNFAQAWQPSCLPAERSANTAIRPWSPQLMSWLQVWRKAGEMSSALHGDARMRLSSAAHSHHDKHTMTKVTWQQQLDSPALPRPLLVDYSPSSQRGGTWRPRSAP